MRLNLKTKLLSFWQYVNSKEMTTINRNPCIWEWKFRQMNLNSLKCLQNTSTIISQSKDTPYQPRSKLKYQISTLLRWISTSYLMNCPNWIRKRTRDHLGSLILKNYVALFYRPLSTIFNESLNAWKFAVQWKLYSVAPIIKKCARSNVENYRCIPKLSTIAKFF